MQIQLSFPPPPLLGLGMVVRVGKRAGDNAMASLNEHVHTEDGE